MLESITNHAPRRNTVAVIALEKVAVSFGAVDVFDDISVEAQPGDRIGLVGRNGAGKTSLLRILGGAEPASAGRKHVDRSSKVTLVEQIPPRGSSHTTVRHEALAAMKHVLDLTQEMENAAEAVALAPEGDETAAAHYAQLLDRLDTEGGFNYESQVSQVLIGLGLPEIEWEKPVSSLSGGQRNRLALAKALLSAPDVLLMDEPTNNLDLRGLQWLEGFLNRFEGAVIVTSHDRYFLDAIATSIWHIEFGRLKTYPGNYSKFDELRAAEIVRQQKEFEAQREVILKEEEFIRRYGAGQRAREAKGREKRLSRVERLEAPKQQRSSSLKFAATRSSDIVLDSKGFSIGYGSQDVLKIDSLDLFRGEHVALVGSNGAGKSTLLKTIAGELTPTNGGLRLGAAVSIGHYWQEAENLDPNSTVMEDLLRDSTLENQQARNLLGNFLFSGHDVDKKVAQLSGGERSRLALAKLVVNRANLLLLDEPTNHLDIPAREALEAALEAYEGTLVFASHDRRLIAAIATRLWVIEDDRLVSFEGTLDEYDASTSAANPTFAATAIQRDGPNPKPALSPNRERELKERLAALEQAVDDGQARLVDLGAQINAASERGDLDAVSQLGVGYEAAQAELNHLMEEWAELVE